MILLAILTLGWPLAAWFYCSRRQERRLHAQYIFGWFRNALQQEQEIVTLREKLNRERRNTGKAEM